MSSTLIPVPAAKPRALAQRSWSIPELLRCAAVGIAALIVALKFAHTNAKPSVMSYSFAAVLVGGTCFSRTSLRALSSPLDIDKTVRKLRSLFVALLIGVFYSAAFPQLRSFTADALLTFAVLTMMFDSAIVRSRVHDAEIFSEARASRGYERAKRFTDVAMASAVLLLLSPILGLIAALIKLESQGPVFFRQDRVGEGGRIFRMLKFRSMYRDAPAYERSPICSRDPRITRVGRALRRLGLDELPQLINVVLGDMSVVGPRPEMPFIVESYTPHQRARLNALPGITGLWQISPARALPIHENLQYDLYYIANRTLLLDAAIVCRTATAVVRGIGAI